MEVYQGNILMRRGDTDSLEFTPTINGETPAAYEMTLTIKRSIDDGQAVLVKRASGNVFYFEEDDTRLLKAGCYVYDIEVRADAMVQTYGPHFFHILPDVTNTRG